MPDDLNKLLNSLDGLRIPGGCDHCDAYQEMKTEADGMYRITVCHDDDCPWWVERKG
jgi:gamma-glutamyl-gamma-aminobutyrate hydrolase PuuD